MDSQLEDKVYSAISPATSIDNICLDFSSLTSFSDLYDHNNQIIGAGGFGIVLLATDRNSQEELAIKILNINRYLVPVEQNKGERRESLALHAARNYGFLTNEVKIMQSLSHPNIVKLVKVKKRLISVVRSTNQTAMS